MSKVLRIQKGGYKVIAEEGSEIRLDSGSGGRVTVTGDLYVEGQTTYINTVDLEIEDRIIILNRGEQGPGITSSSTQPMSGLQIDRGNVDALMVFDEQPFKSLTSNPNENTLLPPSFVLKDNSNTKNLLPLTTNKIQTYGLEGGNKDLTIWTGYEGVIKVDYLTTPAGETEAIYDPYHIRIQNLLNSSIAEIQDQANDMVPNIKFIREYVRASAGEAVIQRFYRYTETTTENTLSGGEARDISQEGDGFSGVQFVVGSGPFGARVKNDVARIGRFGLDNGMIIGQGAESANNIRIVIDNGDNAVIKTDNTDLQISPSTRNIVLKSVLRVENLSNEFADPTPVVGENVLFVRQELGSGGTGVYFTNVVGNGEFCSASNALVYSLIF
jgi:hypothetical protein